MNDAPGTRSNSERRKRRSNATPEEKADWARRFAESGLGQREFCRQEGLVLTTLQRWLAQASGIEQGGAKTQTGFVEVKVSPPVNTSRWAAEVCRSNGTLLRLAHDVPPELLQQLLRTC